MVKLLLNVFIDRDVLSRIDETKAMFYYVRELIVKIYSIRFQRCYIAHIIYLLNPICTIQHSI